MKFSILHIAILFLLLVACTPEKLEIEVGQAESEVVVASQVVPNQLMVVTLTRSFSALEGSSEEGLSDEDIQQFLVKDALVTITYLDRVDTLFSFEDIPGVYFSVFDLEEDGEDFHLEVYDSLSQKTLTSSSTMLPRVTLDSVWIRHQKTDFDTAFYFGYQFTDPEEDNWYVTDLFKVSSDSTEQFNFGLTGNGRVVTTDLVSDQTFGDSVYTNEYRVFEIGIGDTLGVSFSNISEDYFRFVDARQRSGGIISSVTAEPVNHPTNVTGGLGFFNTHNPDYRFIIVQE